MGFKVEKQAARKARKEKFGKSNLVDVLNEDMENRVLHPTKGWRKYSPKRARIEVSTNTFWSVIANAFFARQNKEKSDETPA